MIVKWHSPFRVIAAAARAVYAKVFRYRVLVPDDVWYNRLDECINCDELDVPNQQCRICTCSVDAKASLALEQCPLKKWKRVWLKKRTI
jgi:hypothetical protein